MPKSFGPEKIGGYLFIAFFILLSDQISKSIVVNSLRLGESTFVASIFNIVRVENRGVTFGLLSGTLQPFVFAFISFIIIIVLCIWGRDNRSYRFPLCLVISGAIGNTADRVIHKAVIDFLDFHLSVWHWPAFNIADSAIVIGVLLLFFISYREKKI
ncbi:MAG: signal peptidase II [Holosporaceae bacterium]|jgi:signal peptidase II|nr:signal peptidase II [Holosporaceae bacterium]